MKGTGHGIGRSDPGIKGPGAVLPTNRLVLLAAVPLFLILAVVAYITVQFASNESAAQQWVAHTYQVIASLRVTSNELASLLIDANPELAGWVRVAPSPIELHGVPARADARANGSRSRRRSNRSKALAFPTASSTIQATAGP